MPATIDPKDVAALAPAVRAIAEQAGEVILAHKAAGFSVDTKTDRTLVTEADHAAEALILPALARLTPDVPIISEEAVHRGEAPTLAGEAEGARAFWLVDPLDGTREFVAGGDEFAVSIGLIAGTRPVFGLIHGPAMGETYWNEGPAQAFGAGGGGPARPLSTRTPPPEGLTVITSRFHGRQRRLNAYLETIAMAGRVLLSSALKFGRLAAGGADLYPRFGPTSEWDTAAGHAILHAAGGRVVTLDGAELTYGKDGFLNPDFLAWGKAP